MTTRVLPCCSRSRYPCYRVPTVATGPTSGEVRTRRWGHYRACSDATWLRWRAHVESGCSGPTGGQSTCCQVQVLEHSPQGGEDVGLGYGTKLSGYTDLRSPRDRAPLPWTRLLATVASGLRRSGLELSPLIQRDTSPDLVVGHRNPRLILERSPVL